VQPGRVAERSPAPADRDGDAIVNVRVGGSVVEVARGTFTLP
jgi:hypothetical protein